MSEAAKFDESNISLSPLKRAFLALERAEARIQELEDGRAEPIAIVGMGCRIPGDEDGIDGYWRLLEAQRSAVGDGVERRFSGLLGDNQLPLAARRAALLEHVDLFDPRHFGISPREAVGMDPQQRLLLEASWEALESAGIDPFSVYQSSTGVYLGISSHDYAQLQLRAGGIEKIDPHFASGAALSVAAGRISYVLGLNGPSLAIDTACSSSLVAVHLACEALRRGECNAALAGGVNLILSPEPSIAFAQAGMLSEEGICRCIFQWGGWLCARRGLRGVVVEAVAGGASFWRPDLGIDCRFSGEPGRSVERLDGTERIGAAVVVACGAPSSGDRSLAGGLCGGARHGHGAGRPDRSRSAGCGVWGAGRRREQASDRLGEDQRGSFGVCGRSGGSDQGGAGLAAGSDSRSAALERSERACSLERVASGGGDGVAEVGADWWSSDWGGEFVWLQRYQRARGGGELGRGSSLGAGVRAARRGIGSHGADGSRAAGAGGTVREVSGGERVGLE